MKDVVVACVCPVTLVSCVTNIALHSPPQGIHFCVPFSHPSTRTIACSYTQCVELVRASFYSKEHNHSQQPPLHIHAHPVLPNHIPISAFRRGTSCHCLALPKDTVSCSICHLDWATEFTFETAAGNISRQLVGLKDNTEINTCCFRRGSDFPK